MGRGEERGSVYSTGLVSWINSSKSYSQGKKSRTSSSGVDQLSPVSADYDQYLRQPETHQDYKEVIL